MGSICTYFCAYFCPVMLFTPAAWKTPLPFATSAPHESPPPTQPACLGGKPQRQHAVGQQVGVGEQRGGEEQVGQKAEQRGVGAHRVPQRARQQGLASQ